MRVGWAFLPAADLQVSTLDFYILPLSCMGCIGGAETSFPLAQRTALRYFPCPTIVHRHEQKGTMTLSPTIDPPLSEMPLADRAVRPFLRSSKMYKLQRLTFRLAVFKNGFSNRANH